MRTRLFGKGALGIVIVALVAGPLSGAFGEGAFPLAAAVGGATRVVDVFNFGYRDHASGTPVVEVAVGDRVEFVWTSGAHSVTSGAGARHVPALGPLDSPVLSSPASWTYEATAPGDFLFTCKLHATMHGVLRVKSSPASLGPNNVVTLAEGWSGDVAHAGRPFTSSLAFRGDKLLALDAGRYHYADPWNGHALGRLTEFTLDERGGVASSRIVATGLADPIGLTVAPNGDVYLTQYGKVSVIRAASYDAGTFVVEDYSTGHPSQSSDFLFLPVTGDFVNNALGENSGLDVDTTGPMGLAVRASDGRLFVSQSAHGTPPDDPILRDVTGLDYDNPYSSAVLAPRGGALTPDQVAARACRNCYDLAFAPDGKLYITENVGPYRARLAPGSGRTPLEGGTVTDWNVLDGVNEVDLSSGTVRRVATFKPDSGIAGTTPTGIAFSPGGEMFVSLMSGFLPQTDDRGEIVIVNPEPVVGAATGIPFAVGLDFPIDLAFAPDGSLYVVEFYTGTIYRFSRD